MTEENNQASSDDAAEKAAKKKGAIKGALAGAAIAGLIGTAVLFGEADLARALSVAGIEALITVPIFALFGWYYGKIVVTQQMRERLKWKWTGAAKLGGLFGAVTYLIVAPDFFFSTLSGTDWLVVLAGLVICVLMWSVLFSFAIDELWLLNPPARRKKILKFLGWSLGAVVGLYLVVLAINIPDEDLLPEAKKVLESRDFTVKEEDNAFFAIAGFDAPKGEDPHAFGRKRVAMWAEQEKKRNPRERNFDEKPLYGGEPRGSGVPLKELDKICDWSKRPCLKEMAGSREIVARYLAENPEWVARYRGLLRLPRFEEHIPTAAQTPVPHYHQALNMSRLRKAQCAVLVADGKTAECLDILAEDIGLARRMLAGARTLIGKNVAAAALGRDYAVLSEVLTAQPAAARQSAERMRQLLAPLGPQEMDIAPALQSEFQWTVLDDLRSGGYSLAEFYSGATGDPGILGSTVSLAALPFLQVNANKNYYWRNLALAIEHCRLPADRYQAESAAFKDKLKSAEPDMSFPAILYNPFGKLLHASAMPAFVTYKARLHDLDGRQRLLRLQWRIVEQQVPADKVAEFVAQAGPEYADPYTGQPMAWDAQKRTLTFIDRHEEWGKGSTKKGLVFAVGI